MKLLYVGLILTINTFLAANLCASQMNLVLQGSLEYQDHALAAYAASHGGYIAQKTPVEEPIWLTLYNHKNISQLELLLRTHACDYEDVRMGGYCGYSLMHIAAEDSNTHVMNLLYEHGASPDIRMYNSLRTPLQCAAAARRLASILWLLKHDAKVNAIDKHGNTALMAAVATNSIAIVSTLLTAGAQPNIQNKIGNTALFIPCRHGFMDVIKILLDHGADPTICNKNNQTPFMWAPDEVKPTLELLFDLYGY